MGNYFEGFTDAIDLTEAEAPGGPRPVDPGLDHLPFDLLDDRRFEILAYRLKCFQFGETARITLMQGVGERGRDVVVYSQAGAIARDRAVQTPSGANDRPRGSPGNPEARHPRAPRTRDPRHGAFKSPWLFERMQDTVKALEALRGSPIIPE